jgi:capsular exopolysaccharide synthesis family protein
MEVAVLEGEGSLLAETLRAFRVNISWKAVKDRGTTVLVTSSTIGEGKTTIATSLARRLAADGLKVLLIEADLRRPRISAMLNLSVDTCIERVLTDSIPLENAVKLDKPSGLHCLVASGESSNPLSLLTSESFNALITKVRDSYQVIILDSPPVLRVADAVLLARWIDMTLFVVRSNLTTLALVSEALRRLPEGLRSNITMALNQVRRRQADPRDFYSGYAQQARAVALSHDADP